MESHWERPPDRAGHVAGFASFDWFFVWERPRVTPYG